MSNILLFSEFFLCFLNYKLLFVLCAKTNHVFLTLTMFVICSTQYFCDCHLYILVTFLPIFHLHYSFLVHACYCTHLNMSLDLSWNNYNKKKIRKPTYNFKSIIQIQKWEWEDAIVRNISIGGLKKLYWFHFLWYKPHHFLLFFSPTLVILNIFLKIHKILSNLIKIYKVLWNPLNSSFKSYKNL